MYSYDEVLQASTEYFRGDELAAKVFVDKYALRNNNDEILEKTPSDMHKRIAKELYSAEKLKYKGKDITDIKDFSYDTDRPLSESLIYSLLDEFKYIVMQGSPMYGLGNPYQYVTVGNCFCSGTRVLTEEGVKNIEDVAIGDSLITHTGEIKRVAQTHKNKLENRTIFDVKCSKTPSFSVTGNHKFLSISKEQLLWGLSSPKWNSIEYLRVGDYIAIPKNNNKSGYSEDIDISTLLDKNFINHDYSYSLETDEENITLVTNYTGRSGHKKANPVKKIWKVDENFAYFLGLWYGDGCVFNSNRVGTTRNRAQSSISKKNKIKGITFTLNSNEKEIIDFVINYGEKTFGIKADINHNTKIDGTTQIVFHSTLIGIVFEKLFGRGFGRKTLFKQAYKWSSDLVYNLLIGLLDSDGTITKDGDIRVVLNNKELIESFYHLSRKHGWLFGVSYGIKSSYARLSFPKNLEFIQKTKRFYKDNRTSIDFIVKNKVGYIELDNYTLVKIEDKSISKKTEEYVYTLGIEEIHSYNVEGVLCQNCYVIPNPYDSYLGIMKTDTEITQITCRRGGVGWDNSKLRPKNAFVKNAAKTTSGMVSFAERFSNTIREVGQHGRRGASLQSLHVKHPDVFEFISIKSDKTRLTGSNISVKFTDKFMNAVNNDKNFELCWPISEEHANEMRITPDRFIRNKVKAKDIWDKFIDSTWSMAEPGAMFIDTVHRESTSYPYREFGFEEVSSNPCVIKGTLIDLKNGQTEVENIKIGDYVKTILGEEKVLDIECVKSDKVVKVEFNNGDIQYVTIHHQYITKNGPISVKEININNDYVLNINNGWTKIKSIEKIQGIFDVYDLYCEDSDTWITSGYVQRGCGEQNLPAYGCCRLLLVNLYSYIKDKFLKSSSFDFDLFKTHAMILQRLGDDLVDIDIRYMNRIIDKIKSDPEPDEIKEPAIRMWQKIIWTAENDRRTGCGFTGLGDALAALSIRYGSEKSIDFCEKLQLEFKRAAYKSSIGMAKVLGHFPVFNKELDNTSGFIQRLKKDSFDIWQEMQIYGRRNMTLLTIAPTGSVSCLTQTTSGLEPVFKLEYTRRKKGNPNDKGFRTDFVDQSGDHWMNFTVRHHGLQDCFNVLKTDKIIDTPYYKSSANEIDWINRIKMQAALQKHIDNSISLTVNLPEDIDKETVSEIYFTAWKLGCKGCTIYRENCRTGVLVSLDKSENSGKIENNAEKRPTDLPCDIYHISVKGKEFFCLIGKLNDVPYEVLAGENGCLSKKAKHGTITKIKRGQYKLVADTGEILDSVTELSENDEEAITRLVSTGLRHNVDISYLVHQLEKTKGSLQSFAKCISRVLKKYVKDGTKVSGETCPSCGGTELYRAEGCVTCSCGYSKCS